MIRYTDGRMRDDAVQKQMPEGEAWEVAVREFPGGGLEIYGRKACLTNEDINAYRRYAMPPNWMERLLRITLKSKTEKRIIECEKWCEQQNKKDAIAAAILKKHKKS